MNVGETIKNLVTVELNIQMGVAAFMLATRSYDRETIAEIVNGWADNLFQSTNID